MFHGARPVAYKRNAGHQEILTMVVSVIVPYYNPQSDAEIDRLLERAVRSAVHELDGHTDFEVIVVNDGSPCRPAIQAACSDSRIRFIDREHGKLGAARNTGIDRSEGDIITFLDSDDFYFEDTLWPCIQAMKETKADLLGFGFMVTGSADGAESLRQPAPVFSQPVTGNDWMRRHNLFGSSCMYLIDRELIRAGGLRFMENSYIEDEEFTPRLVFASRRYVHTAFKVYGYYRRPGSITNLVTRSAVEQRERDALAAVASLVSFRRTVSHLPADGLDRKISTLAIDCLRRALRRKEWRTDVMTAVDGLKSIGLYPVPASALPLGMKLYARLAECRPGCYFLHFFERIAK